MRNICKEALHTECLTRVLTKCNDKFKMQCEYEEILARIKSELRRQGWKYYTFAKEFGKSEGWLSLIMTGQRRFTVDMLLEIAEKLKVDPRSLLPESKTNPHKETKPPFEEFLRLIIREEIEKCVPLIIKNEFEKLNKKT